MANSNPRGIRNFNPGNIRHGDKWQGLAAVQSDPDFCTFAHEKWGIRAICRLLITYQDKYGLNTIRGIITRWAPPVESNTNSYITHVSLMSGIEEDEPLNVHDYDDLEPLVKAIIYHENGQQPYNQATIDAGLRLAGVEPPAKAISDSRTIQGGAGAAVGGAAITAGSVVEIARGAAVLDLGSTLQVAIGIAIVAFAAYAIYARWDDRRNGRG